MTGPGGDQVGAGLKVAQEKIRIRSVVQAVWKINQGKNGSWRRLRGAAELVFVGMRRFMLAVVYATVAPAPAPAPSACPCRTLA